VTTDAHAATTATPEKSPRSARRIVGLLLALYFVPACGLTLISGGGLAFLVGIPFRIAFGIINYPRRVLPLATVDWDGVVTFVVALALLALVAHALFVAISRARGASRAWSFRSTATFIAAVLSLFVAAMAVAGVGHQVGWLLTTKERLTDNPWETGACRMSHVDSLAPWLERWRILPLDGEPVWTSEHYIAVPRDAHDPAIRDRRARVCGGAQGPGSRGEPIDDEEVARLLRSTTSGVPAPPSQGAETHEVLEPSAPDER